MSKATRNHQSNKQILLIASGDMRPSANQTCWDAQHAMEQALAKCVKAEGYTLKRAHPYKKDEKHGFIASQKEGMEVFAKIDPKQPLIVAEAVWQYSHHVLAGLVSHRGPILTVANWSGTWPGLVGMLNLNGSLTKAGVKYSTLWSNDFSDDYFTSRLRDWLKTGTCRHRTAHAKPLAKAAVPAKAKKLGEQLAAELAERKAIMGVFDEGCMGPVPNALLRRFSWRRHAALFVLRAGAGGVRPSGQAPRGVEQYLQGHAEVAVGGVARLAPPHHRLADRWTGYWLHNHCGYVVVLSRSIRVRSCRSNQANSPRSLGGSGKPTAMCL